LLDTVDRIERRSDGNLAGLFVDVDKKDRRGICHRPRCDLLAVTGALVRICQPNAQNRKVIAKWNTAGVCRSEFGSNPFISEKRIGLFEFFGCKGEHRLAVGLDRENRERERFDHLFVFSPFVAAALRAAAEFLTGWPANEPHLAFGSFEFLLIEHPVALAPMIAEPHRPTQSMV
jgi:hypothetical protein